MWIAVKIHDFHYLSVVSVFYEFLVAYLFRVSLYVIKGAHRFSNICDENLKMIDDLPPRCHVCKHEARLTE